MTKRSIKESNSVVEESKKERDSIREGKNTKKTEKMNCSMIKSYVQKRLENVTFEPTVIKCNIIYTYFKPSKISTEF